MLLGHLSIFQTISKLVNKYSFLLVATALFIFESFAILKGNWQSDFWDHSSAIKALSENLLHPSHPYLKLNTPHPFFSPYSVAVAAFAKAAHLNSIQALTCMAFFNLVLFLFSFYRFCQSLFKEKASLIAALGLIFALFLWGNGPYGWSGFYHFMVLHSVLPYPSTFAISLTFLTLSILINNFKLAYFDRPTIWIILLSTIVFITHPNTGILLFILIIGLNFSLSGYTFKFTFLRSFLLIVTTILLSFFWPYFNMPDVLFSYNEEFNTSWERLYHGERRIAWPFLALIPGIFFAPKNKITYFFFVSVAIMVVLFVAGYFLKMYGFSRLISGIMMFTQILIAYLIVTFFFHKNVKRILYIFFVSFCFLFCLLLNRKLIIETFYIPTGHFYKGYEFLREKINPDDLVLSDLGSSLGIPSFNGKVISTGKPVYWIKDSKERREAVKAFFTKENPDSLRKIIIDKYNPDYILLDSTRLDLKPSTIQWIRSLGETIYKKKQLELIRIKKLNLSLEGPYNLENYYCYNIW